MGCVASKNGDAKAERFSRWKATGIVALCDAKLKAIVCLKQSFPDEVLELDRSVRTIDFTHNRLGVRLSLPDNQFLNNIDIIEYLGMHIQTPPDIPEDISKLTNMQRLILADNLIEHLPTNVGKLQSLKFINLDKNRVAILPDELGQLVRLERLSISGNQLYTLPETIGSLRNIPPSLLKSCKTLQNISLHDNPISMDQFQSMEGFQEFEARRKKKHDKQIDSNVMIGSKGLDEGVDL
ncbi:plant intracellular Ras-group-related LRR protein 7 [Tanacetum coccineum]